MLPELRRPRLAIVPWTEKRDPKTRLAARRVRARAEAARTRRLVRAFHSTVRATS